MSEFKGTKGKWEYEVVRNKCQTKITVQIPGTKYESKTELILGYLDKEDDCDVSTCCKITEHANAKLIACAPEMLEMLQKIQLTFDMFTMPTEQNLKDYSKEIEDLIKKATL